MIIHLLTLTDGFKGLTIISNIVAAEPLKALTVDDQNNHHWADTCRF